MSESGRVDANFHEYVHAAPDVNAQCLAKGFGEPDCGGAVPFSYGKNRRGRSFSPHDIMMPSSSCSGSVKWLIPFLCIIL